MLLKINIINITRIQVEKKKKGENEFFKLSFC